MKARSKVIKSAHSTTESLKKSSGLLLTSSSLGCSKLKNFFLFKAREPTVGQKDVLPKLRAAHTKDGHRQFYRVLN